jgi:hypothetical protein
MAEDQSPVSASPAVAATPATPTQPNANTSITAGLTPAAQVDAIVADQHSALIGQFADDKGNGAYIACSDLHFMEETRCRNSKGNKVGQVLPVEGTSIENAFVLVDAEGKHELWARPDYSDYAGVYDKYTKKYYGVEWSKIASGDDWNVDHLFPRTAGEIKSMKYVRLTAIDKRANGLMGCTIESQMAKRAREAESLPAEAGRAKRGPRPVLMATPFTIGKMTAFHDSIRLPKDRSDFADLGVTQRLAVHVSNQCKSLEPAVISRLNEVLTRQFATDIQTPLKQRFEKRDKFSNSHPEFFGPR